METAARFLGDWSFWIAWMMFPLLLEVLPACAGMLLLVRRHRRAKTWPALKQFPTLTIIVPVYHSQNTLADCVRSIAESSYPASRICVLLVDNSEARDCYPIYLQCRRAFPDLNILWLESEQGKAQALNMGLYNSYGDYIITLDSDGMLDPNALTELIQKFQANPNIGCMTGVVLPRPDHILARRSRSGRLLCRLEFLEYAQSFLPGRSRAAEVNMLYTLSGAFSAFRRSAILSSQLYHTGTLGEDTHITFQLRRRGERVELCERAFFYVEPIEGLEQLYPQRQRWQRGSLEVARLFSRKKGDASGPAITVQTLLRDHTLSFFRLIWYLSLLYTALFQRNAGILVSVGVVYLIYLFLSAVCFPAAAALMEPVPETRRFYLRCWPWLPLLPLFQAATFFMRLAGILNGSRCWCARTFREERQAAAALLRKDFARPSRALKKIRRRVNGGRPRLAPHPARPGAGSAWSLCFGTELVVCVLLLVGVFWSKTVLDVEFSQVLSTLLSPLKGAGQGVLRSAAVWLLGLALAGLLLLAVGLWMKRRRNGRRRTAARRVAAAVLAALVPVTLLYVNRQYELLSVYANAAGNTAIYEDYYVDPGEVSISGGGTAKNLIYIYVESLETTYASAEDGGFQSVNYIPRLTALASENLSFSDTGLLGGFHNLNGTNYTLAALFATTTGLPYTSEAMGNVTMPGVTSLGDILAGFGYTQEFLCGSDSEFSGRDTYFTTHGEYAIFDVYSAQEAGYLSEDEWTNWGVEDYTLFQIARDEVTRLAAQGQPFNFTMLTVDLHAPEGYLCSQCGDEYDSVTANVAACSDRLTAEFVAWCQEQDFYQDTVIVITGDHPRMDSNLVSGVSRYDRTVYNCILNAGQTPALDSSSRTFTALDIFPTVLSALGCEIEGGRLGLGTDLFSDRETLAEELGYDALYQELSKSSEFYVERFVTGPTDD